MSLTQSERSRLKELLVRKSLSFGEVKLASGGTSTVYVDGKLTTYSSAAMPLIGGAVLEEIERQGWKPEAIGGLTLGADPIAFAAAMESRKAQSEIDAFVVRKAPKDHGKERFIEGLQNPAGRRVVIAEDVCTKGGSTGQAIEKAREAGMIVLGAICLVDREQGASEYLEQTFGCKLARIFTLAELLACKSELEAKEIPVTG